MTVCGKACGCSQRAAPSDICVQGQAPGEEGKDDTQYFESLSVFVSKVRGETFSWEQARDMTFKDIAKNVEVSATPFAPFAVSAGTGMRMLQALLLRLTAHIDLDFELGLPPHVAQDAAGWLGS